MRQCSGASKSYFTKLTATKGGILDYNNWNFVQYKTTDGSIGKFVAFVTDVTDFSAFEKRTFSRKVTEGNNIKAFYSSDRNKVYFSYDPPYNNTSFIFYA